MFGGLSRARLDSAWRRWPSYGIANSGESSSVTELRNRRPMTVKWAETPPKFPKAPTSPASIQNLLRNNKYCCVDAIRGDGLDAEAFPRGAISVRLSRIGGAAVFSVCRYEYWVCTATYTPMRGLRFRQSHIPYFGQARVGHRRLQCRSL